MKKTILSLFASFALVVTGLTVVIPAGTVSAINVFQNACGGNSGTGTGTGSGSNTNPAPSTPNQGGSGGGALEGQGGAAGEICGATQQDNFQTLMQNIINTILVVLGMIAVIMIIIGGVRYTTSNGDSSQIQSAKNTILYSVVGLVVAILSFAIVNFVLGAFGGGGEAS